MPLVLKDKILPGSDDPAKFPVKRSALVDDEMGLSASDALLLLGLSSTDQEHDPITISNAAVATKVSEYPIDIDYDVIKIQWVRGTGSDFEFRQTFEIPIYELLDDVDTAASAGDTLVYATNAVEKQDHSSNRVLLLGRTETRHVLLQATSLPNDTRVTVEAGDIITITYSTYERGIVGGKFRKRDVVREPLLVIRRGAASTPPTSGFSFDGYRLSMPSSSGFIDVRDSRDDRSSYVYYWTKSSYSYSSGVYSFEADADNVWLQTSYANLQSSDDGVTWHQLPWRPDDRYIRIRKSATSAWEVYDYGTESKADLFTLLSTTSIDASASLQLEVTPNEDLHMKRTAFLLFRWQWSGSTNQYAYVLIPTTLLRANTDNTYDWQDGVSFILSFSKTPGGSGFSHYNLQPSASDDIQSMRFRLRRFHSYQHTARRFRVSNLSQTTSGGDGTLSVFRSNF